MVSDQGGEGGQRRGSVKGFGSNYIVTMDTPSSNVSFQHFLESFFQL